MKRIFTICVATLAAVACNTQKESLRIEIDGWANDTILVLSAPIGEGETESMLVAKNGVVSYNLEVDDTVRMLFLNKRTAVGRPYSGNSAKEIMTVVYPGSNETIVGKVIGDKVEYTSQGSDEMFAQAAEMNTKLLASLLKSDRLNRQIEDYSSNSNTQAKEELFKLRGEQGDLRYELKKEFIKKNPKSNLAGLYTSQARYEDIIELTEMLDKSVRSGIFKDIIESEYLTAQKYALFEKNKELIKEGAVAPAFTLKNEKGEDVSLSNFRGKWVVLDFWGMWCPWCIKGFPDMKEAYEKHKGESFEIIGIACKDSQQEWLAGIKEHALPWVNLINQEALMDDVSVRYAVEGYPTKIIIDPEGKITKIVVGEDPTFYTELDKVLLKKN